MLRISVAPSVEHTKYYTAYKESRFESEQIAVKHLPLPLQGSMVWSLFLPGQQLQFSVVHSGPLQAPLSQLLAQTGSKSFHREQQHKNEQAPENLQVK